jgi:hypothetical protein
MTFHCDTNAIPSAKVLWMSNGANIRDDDPTFIKSQDGTSLTVRSLCKTGCEGGESDIAVFQCNASNTYGYAFGQGYLNVLTKTVITEAPQPVTAKNITDPVIFTCKATTDITTGMNFNWLFEDVLVDTGLPYYKRTGDEAAGFSQLEVILSKVPEDPNKAEGKYTCEAKNGYSTDSKSALLDVAIVSIPGGVETSTASVGDYWYIFVIIVVIIAIIIIIYLIYYFCCHKGAYEAGKIEDKAPYIDVKQDIDDMDFHDYNRPEDAALKGSQPSLNSNLKLASDDEGSMEDYGEPDFSKFNEDGSFLNQYDNLDSRHRSQPTDSIV